MRSSLLVLGLGVGSSLAACGNDVAEPTPEPVARATWYQDVAPIVSKHCMSCHQEGGIGPFSLTEYDQAVENSARMIDNIEKGVMPPFDAREEADCTPRFGWKDDPRLTDAEKNTLHTWIEDGHALGTVAAIPPPASIELPNVSQTLTPATGWATSGNKDQFVCFIFDPGNTTLKWIDGLQVRPDNEAVVHHAVITELGEGQRQTDLVAAHGIGQPFDCDGMDAAGDFVVSIWTPGNQPMQTTTGLAVPLLAKSKLMMQIHYHPAGQTHTPDKTAIDLRFTTQWPKKMYFVTAIGNEQAAPNLEPGAGDLGTTPRFFIPANAADHTEKMFRDIPTLGGATGVKLFSVNPHMHLVGTKISSHIVRPTARNNEPARECLANGGWNFDWQRTYIYDTDLDSLPSVEAGDRIEVSCSWNNTMANPFVQRMLADSNLPPQPIDITLGEQTTNEMCLEIFGLAIDAPANPLARTVPIPEFVKPGRLAR